MNIKMHDYQDLDFIPNSKINISYSSELYPKFTLEPNSSIFCEHPPNPFVNLPPIRHPLPILKIPANPFSDLSLSFNIQQKIEKLCQDIEVLTQSTNQIIHKVKFNEVTNRFKSHTDQDKT
jgi:hypothetical protein